MTKYKLFFTFLKISTLTLGGGYAMVPIIQKEIIKKNVLDQEEFMILFSKAQSAPGPIAINTAFMIGLKLSGVLLGLYYIFAVILPPFITISLIVLFLKQYVEILYVKYFFQGIRIGISVILIQFFLNSVKKFKIFDFIFIILGFILLYFFKLSSILTLILITFIYFIFSLKKKDVN